MTIYSDIKQLPNEMPARDGSNYYIVYVCAYTDFVVIYGLKRKSDATSTIALLNTLLGLSKLNYSVKIVTDGDGSYKQPFTEACLEFGIQHEYTPPYTPQHNKAERTILSIDSMARTMLIDAPHLDFNDYYLEASKHAVYVHNRTVGTRGKTPYELLKGQQPLVKHLRPFGCQGYMHADKKSNKRQRLPPGVRAEEVVLLGYRSPFSNQWKVQLNDSKRIVFSIHVDWNEDSHGLDKVLSSDHLKAIMDEAGFEMAGLELPEVNKSQDRQQIRQQISSNSTTNSESTNLGQSTTNSEADHKDGNQKSRDQDVDVHLNKAYVSIPPLPNIDHLEQRLESKPSLENPTSESSDPQQGQDPVPPYYGANDAIAEINPANIVDYDRRGCNHVTVINEARVHRVLREVRMDDALNSPEASAWMEAIDKEKAAILRDTALEIDTDHELYDQAKKEATPSRIILTEKRDGRKKARWVVQGCFEDRSFDDINNHAHTASLNAFRSMCFRRDRRSRTLGAIDISTAFLQSHRYQPHEPIRTIKLWDPTLRKYRYYLLLGPMYGQRSAPVRWENTISPWMIEIGFARGENEPCAFYREEDDLTVLIYVDDIIADGDEQAIKNFFNKLRSRFNTTDPVYLSIDNTIDFLGIIISRSESQIKLSMESYHEKLLKNMDMSEVKPLGAPLSEQILESEELSLEEATRYRSGVGGIGWLASTIRPDLSYTFSRLGQHLAKPTINAMKALMHTLRYVAGTKSAALIMPLDVEVKTSENRFSFFSDSDHAGNSEIQNLRRSQSGRLAQMNGTPIAWHSSTQSITTVSSTEAEIYAASNAVQNFMHIGFVISELGISGFPKPFTLQVDNRAAIIFMEKSAGVSRLKHIDCRLNWVKQMRDQQVVLASYVSSSENLADLFTKILPGTVFRGLRDQILSITKH